MLGTSGASTNTRIRQRERQRGSKESEAKTRLTGWRSRERCPSRSIISPVIQGRVRDEVLTNGIHIRCTQMMQPCPAGGLIGFSTVSRAPLCFSIPWANPDFGKSTGHDPDGARTTCMHKYVRIQVHRARQKMSGRRSGRGNGIHEVLLVFGARAMDVGNGNPAMGHRSRIHRWSCRYLGTWVISTTDE